MAIQLKQSFSVNVGNVVATAISAARKAKSEQQSKMEADFQTAIADGSMSYEAQLAFREKQLAQERKNVFIDPDYIATLEQSIGNIKRLNRFAKYRSRYQESLASLAAGKETARDHLSQLRSMLSSTTDPDLRQEILGNITDAEKSVKSYDDTVFENQVKKAQYDGTTKILNETISQVQDRMSLAKLEGNEEEVSALDVTLTVLQQQKNKADVEDVKSSLNVQSITKGLNPFEKINALNEQISTADSSGPITLDGQTYSSVKDYWTQTRDAYLSGNGTGLFSNFFSEVKSEYQDKIDTAVARDGFATTATLDAIKADVDLIRSKPEFLPYVDQVDNLGATAMASAFDSTAKTILERADYTGDFALADTSLLNYALKYGVSVDSYRIDLGNKLAAQVKQAASDTGLSAAQVEQQSGVQNVAPASEFKIPETPAPGKPAPGTTPTTEPAAGSITTRTVVAGDSLSKIASDAGLSLTKLLELNPQFKTNPNLIREGDVVNLSTSPPPAPVVTPPTGVPEPIKSSPTSTASPVNQQAEQQALEALSRETAAISSGNKVTAKAATASLANPTPTASSPSTTISFREGLTDTQKASITALSKKTGQWSDMDVKNWNYATNNSKLPPGAIL